MTDSNRVQLAGVREVTIGTTPNTPRMRKMRFTGEGLLFRPDFVTSDEIRDDRMTADPIKVGETNSGPINFEWHYPVDGGLLSSLLESVFMNAWTNTPTRDNDGTADSVITAVTATTDVVTVTTGAAFVAGHLGRTTGFTNAANNGVFVCTTGSATVPAFLGANFVTEAAPPAAARLKVVGAQGGDGELAAVSDGITSSGLALNGLGLAVGQWIKIGGTGAAFRFATEACNGWARVTVIAADKLTLDNLPSGWTTDAGTGKTVRIWFGDQVKNGTTKLGQTVERGFLGQNTPTYVAQAGMIAGQITVNVPKKQKITAAIELLGMSGAQGTSALDASPDAAPSIASYPVMAGSANVGRIAENGAALSSPNWADNVSYTVNNNLRLIEAADNVGAVSHGVGECTVTVALNSYFGSNALYAKLLAGTPTNVNTRVTKNSQATIWAVPRLTATDGNPNAQGKNQDVMLPLQLGASRDDLTAAHVILDRLEYFEA